MKKIIVVFIIIVIFGIGVTASLISMEKTGDERVNIENNIILDENIPVEEEPKETGRSLTVELTESIGLKTP